MTTERDGTRKGRHDISDEMGALERWIGQCNIRIRMKTNETMVLQKI